MFNLVASLDHHAERRPDAEVLRCGDRRLTYRELHGRVDAVAAGLAERGVDRGDVVALLLLNCPEFLETTLAVAKLGAVFLPLNYRLAPAEWAYILGHGRARVVVSEPELAGRLDTVLDSLPELGHRVLVGGEPSGPWVGYEDLLSSGGGVPTAEVGQDHLQRLMYTSGTTSRPKGVMITHGNVLWKNAGHILEFGITAADRTLVCGPLYHCGAYDLPASAVLQAGGSVVVHRSFDAAAVVRSLHGDGITNVWLAPAMLNAVMAQPDLDSFDFSGVRFVINGGEKMPVPLIERVLAAFPWAWFADAYGLTETVSGDTFNDREHAISKLGSVGRPVQHLEVRIVDEAGSDVPAGALGEIALRGPKVFPGYWRDEAATAAAIRDGWFHTGDIGRLDEDGFLYVEDRKKDIIVSGGENIATPEVERALYEHPAILEAAVIGIAHPRWGEVPKAFVAVHPGQTLTGDDLVAFCRQRLAGFKVPAEVTFVDALPRNPSGKVLKRELRDHAGSEA
ncbi:MAG: long-chain-fatty-acid--CoA ligase [Pseudonocardiaceae bacterium]|nr:long-chain-fatty-acid--CoA ligase [Pseudonocardiaceae bacterium]